MPKMKSVLPAGDYAHQRQDAEMARLRERVAALEGLLRDACIGHDDGRAHWQSCAWCRAVYDAPKEAR